MHERIRDLACQLILGINEAIRESKAKEIERVAQPRPQNRRGQRRKAQVCLLEWCDSSIGIFPEGRVGHFYYEKNSRWENPVEIQHTFKERRLKDRRAC